MRYWWQIALVVLAAVGLTRWVRYLDNQEQLARDAATAARSHDSARAEQDRREYVARRRNECYDIYVKERTKWNNAQAPEYNEVTDRCAIRYKNTSGRKPKCIEPAPDAMDLLRDMYLDCLTGTFTQEF